MQTLSHAAIVNLPPELSGSLTFHLPMELVALRDAGASPAVMQIRTNQRMAEAYATGLVDPPMYRWAVERYSSCGSALLSDNPTDKLGAARDIEPLAEGLAGAAFHGLIRLGYGAWQRDADELTRGLAYMRTRRQVLSSPDPTRRVAMSHDADMPSAEQRANSTVFDLLNLVAGTGACVPRQSTGITTPSLLARAAAALVQRNPSSFVAVHAMTGLHALCEVHALVTGEAPGDDAGEGIMAGWWMAFAVAARACNLLVMSEEPEPATVRLEFDTLDALVSASIKSNETHDVKLAVALRRMVHFGVMSSQEAIAVGVARLSSSALQAC